MTTSLTQYIDLYTQHAEAICAHAMKHGAGNN